MKTKFFYTENLGKTRLTLLLEKCESLENEIFQTSEKTKKPDLIFVLENAISWKTKFVEIEKVGKIDSDQQMK